MTAMDEIVINSTCVLVKEEISDEAGSYGELIHVKQEEEMLIPYDVPTVPIKVEEGLQVDCVKSSDQPTKKRSTAFSNLERDYFKRQVALFKDIIENKNTDRVSIKEKSEAWGKITLEFNSIPGHFQRTEKQLKKYWDNLKTERKKELSARKREILDTGGGPAPKYVKDDSMDNHFMNTFSKEIEGAVDSVTLALSEKQKDEMFALSEQGVLETCNMDVLDKSENMDNPDSEINVEDQELPSLLETRAAPLPVSSNPLRGGRGGLRKEMVARAKRIEAQIEKDAAINSFLQMEAKYKALAAKETFKEKQLLAQKAEVELKIKKLELEELLKKTQT